MAALMSACGGVQSGDAATPSDAAKQAGIDYMALVNKTHALPEGWEDAVEIVHFKNTEDWDVDVEAKAYDAYLALKEDLEADDVYVDLDSAYRSVEEQQRIVDDFTEKYGEEYVKKYVAVPGYSEHHTGLALDLFLIIDGKGVYLNEEMVTYPEIWDKIHAKLADHGFILRYLPGKKIFTGYSYEPWHIRYLDDPAIAREIADAGLTFEEYLDAVDPAVAGCQVDYGTSQLYKEPDMDAALDVILAEFSTWKGCVMQRFAYAGDEACSDEELAYVNELREAQKADLPAFDQAIVFVTDFHSPSEADAEGTAWEPDTDYKDWTWHLGRTGDDGAWELLTWGMG
jgi:D-alanyl-D-alanine carboxypeptidase